MDITRIIFLDMLSHPSYIGQKYIKRLTWQIAYLRKHMSYELFDTRGR